MSITVRIVDKTPEKLHRFEAAVERFIAKGALVIQQNLRDSMGEGKSGRRYGSHIASAPGESPAIDSENLTNSIEAIIAANRLEAKIGTVVEYAPYLEYGTSAPATRSKKLKKGQAGPLRRLMGPHRGGILPRPMWEPVAKDSLPVLDKILKDEVAKAN